MTWQKILSRESKYLVLAVLISSLFWVALAGIIEQNIIAQEYLYARERNGFVLTLAFLCIIRLSRYMNSREGVSQDDKLQTRTPLSQSSDPEELMIVGEAKDMVGDMTNNGEQAAPLIWVGDETVAVSST